MARNQFIDVHELANDYVRVTRAVTKLRPGAAIAFTVAIDGSTSTIESLRVRRYQSLKQKPSEYRQLDLLSRLAAGGEAVKPLEPGSGCPTSPSPTSRASR